MLGKEWYYLFFYLLIFPGFLFTAVLGSLAAVMDRKVSARFQYRVGPPWHQSFTDFFKLLGKETVLIRNTLTPVYIAAPLAALASVILASSLIGAAAFLRLDLAGDILFYVYLLLIFTVCLILGAFASGNVYAGQGAQREINLLLAYELPFFLSILIPVVKTGFTLKMSEFVAWQTGHGAIVASFSGAIGFLTAVLCIQAKMGLTPFDVAEAETELAGGILMEYSGPLLGFWKLAHNMLYAVLPLTVAVLFLGGVFAPPYWIGFLKYLGVVVLMIIIRNTNPRLKIDGILRFFWKPLSVAALAGVILALLGY
ncbi:MAG: complex I subunit 1 family protein [Bacillota bacterium]